MARIRTIKPSFYTNEDLGQLSPTTRLLFTGLWCVADREGRLEDRPVRLKVELLPYDDDDVNVLLDALASANLISRYEVDSKRYIQITNFIKHQRPHPKEPPSLIPAVNGREKKRPAVKRNGKDTPSREKDAPSRVGMEISEISEISGMEPPPPVAAVVLARAREAENPPPPLRWGDGQPDAKFIEECQAAFPGHDVMRVLARCTDWYGKRNQAVTRERLLKFLETEYEPLAIVPKGGNSDGPEQRARARILGRLAAGDN